MAKKIQKVLKLEIKGGQATPAPPTGPLLGQAGVNIGEFVNQFNAKTKEANGELLRVVLTVYEDRSFDFDIKSSPASAMIKKMAKIDKGSGKQKEKKAGSITKSQLKEIAEAKMADLNANDIEGAMKIVEGTAKSMGVEVR